MNILRAWVVGSVLGLMSACGAMAEPADGCAGDRCVEQRTSDGVICDSDAECPSGMCGADGLCTEAQYCSVTSACPIDMYCNTALPVPLCAALPTGSCRQASQCRDGLVCSAVTGGVGKCVECLVGTDCASGSCNLDGTCAATGSTGTPENPDPQPADCPANAHTEGDRCVCDQGWEPNAAGTGCAPVTTTTPTGTGSDPCAQPDRYGDGRCDTDCLEPDPDCSTSSTDPCEQYGYYGDGECDDFCLEPDPDCSGTTGSGGGDICAERGYYDDGICDDFCAEPDPDCSGGGSTGGGCGDVTAYGDCDGDTLLWCEDGVLQSLDCAAEGAVCALYSYQEGYFCIVYD